MKLFSILTLAFLASFTESVNMADLGPMRETVGIRQVTHNGVKLPPAMRLDVVGGDLTTTTAEDGVVTYKLDLSEGDASAAAIISLETRVAKLEAGLQVPDVYVAPGGYSEIPAIAGQTIRVDVQALGADEGVTVRLPLADAANKGLDVTVIEVGCVALFIDNTGPRLWVKTTSPQGLSGIPGPYPVTEYLLTTNPPLFCPNVTFQSTGTDWVRKSGTSY
jgi:hypothetical protein